MARSTEARTPRTRFAFTQGLFNLQDTPSGPKWNVTFLFDKKTSLASLEKLVAEAIVSEWGEKGLAMAKNGAIKSPFLDGDGPQGRSKKTGEPHPGFPGHTFIRANSGEKYRPTVWDRKLQPITEEKGIPSGYYGTGVVSAYTWESKEQGKGVSFNVRMVQVTEPGEVLGGGEVRPEAYFEALDDAPDASTVADTAKGASGLFG